MSHLRLSNVFFKEDGAVTVFAVVVLSALLLFFSILIDYARIAAFQLKSENAMRTGVRSVLSAYDSSLYERYGLFGRGGTDGKAILEKVLEGNMGKGDVRASQPFLNVLPARINKAELSPSSYLGQHDVFARQVLEEMKYKAPIQFTLELIAKFAPLAGALKESSSTVQTLEQLRKLYERREDLLERALRLQEGAVEAVMGNGAWSLVPAGSASGSLAGTALALAEEYGLYVAQKQMVEALGEEAQPADREQVAEYEAQISDMILQLRRDSDLIEKRHAELLTEARQKVEGAESINSEMKRMLEADGSSSRQGYDKVAGAKSAGAEAYSVPNSASQEIAEMKRNASTILRSPQWFLNYEAELEEQGMKATAATIAIETLLSRWSAAMSNLADQSLQTALLLGPAEIAKRYAAYEHSFSVPGLTMKQRRESVLDSAIKGQLSRQKEQANTLWRDAGRMLGGLATVPHRPDYNEVFQQVRGRFEQNLRFNEKAAAAEEVVPFSGAGNANEGTADAVSFMDGLFAGMSDMVQKSQDYVYFGEYAASRFSFFEPQQLSLLLKNGDLEGVSEAASFHNQEMEYVLYGFHDPLGNLVAAYGELFAARLAVRTMEGLIESRGLGHPLLVLSGAIIYGLQKTIEDLISFTEKGSAPLSKYVRTELSYLDYLRLFMLIHGGRTESRLSRMIAVIEQNTGLELASVPSGVSGEARLSMDLWFLPGVMKVLGRFDLLQGRVVGHRYETTEIAGWSY
ncbi:TadE/TadG family type IV pilus assembly protein [Paenibacillus sp. GCM10027627]|uniref:TadE/TadG family type IV pilus assembly protein n=1 Tax=unclassified Paenibacillus TaxID=185978 RepID=UPI0036296C93